MRTPDRRQLVRPGHGLLSIRRQCELLGIARSGIYWPPPPANDNDLALMRRIDELFTAWPFLGWRRVAAMLRGQVHAVNRKRARRLMRKMGMAALGPKPRTTRPAPGHEILPYLLRGPAIERPNQVWCADIAYIPIGRGFLYVVAINGLGEPGGAVVAAVQRDGRLVRRRRARGGARALCRPELFNTDQGSQFTSAGFTGKLMAARVRISMDGRGRWIEA